MSSAFLFPGQGSQSIGMLADLAAEHAAIQATFKQASNVLGYDLWDLCQQGEEARLNQTEVTQPALLTAGVAMYRAWTDAGGAAPTMMAGHSLGEYSALVCADALDFEEAVAAVQTRGQLMQAAVADGEGAMAAVIGLGAAGVEALCETHAEGQTLEAVNYNAATQVVIAGHKAAVERACAAAKSAGARMAVMLPVSVPAHSSLMRPAAEKMQGVLANMRVTAPNIPVLHNVNATVSKNADEVRKALVEQLDHPVLWVKTLSDMVDAGIETVYECGPGQVLAGLCKRGEKRLSATALSKGLPL